MFLHFSLFLFCIFCISFVGFPVLHTGRLCRSNHISEATKRWKSSLLYWEKNQPRCEKQLVVLGVRPVFKASLQKSSPGVTSRSSGREIKPSLTSLGSDCPSGVLQSFRKWKRRAINTSWLNSRPREAFTRPRCSLCRSDCVPEISL